MTDRVKIKPLVWENRSDVVHPQFKAVTGFGTYYIERDKGGLFNWWTPALRGKVQVQTIEAADAAANEHHAAAILSAIDVHDDQHDALEEQVRILTYALHQSAQDRDTLRDALEYYANEHANPNDGPWGVNSGDFGQLARHALNTPQVTK